MKNKYLLLLDSGVGGLSILKNYLEMNSRTNLIYYADTQNFPYGKKEENEIGEILLKIYSNLKSKYDIVLIVIVCNTASVSALEYLRSQVEIQIIGTVPAIKPAALMTKNNKIGIIATETTIRSGYVPELIKEYASDKEIFIVPAPGLVDAVENGYTLEQINDVMKKELNELKENDIDTLVLGCTHYSFLKESINVFFDGKVRILDSIEGVSKRILKLLPNDIYKDEADKILYLSKKDENINNRYQSINNENNLFNKIIIEDLSCQKA